MKAYREKQPVMVIGGKCGSFLGEYQAGGTIIVLGLTPDARPIVSNFTGTGMHGGKLYLRADCSAIRFPSQVHARKATEEDLQEIKGYIAEFCNHFHYEEPQILRSAFTLVTPNSKNPYKQMYVAN